MTTNNVNWAVVYYSCSMLMGLQCKSLTLYAGIYALKLCRENERLLGLIPQTN